MQVSLGNKKSFGKWAIAFKPGLNSFYNKTNKDQNEFNSKYFYMFKAKQNTYMRETHTYTHTAVFCNVLLSKQEQFYITLDNNKTSWIEFKHILHYLVQNTVCLW